MRKPVIGVAVAVSGLSWPLFVERFESESWPTWVIFTVAMVSTLTALVATAWPKIRRGAARRTTKPPPVGTGRLRPPKGSALYEQQRAKAREIARQFYRARLPWWKRLMVAGLAPKSPPTHVEDSGERINRFEAEKIASESAVATILKDSYLTGSAAVARDIVAIYEEAYPGPIRRGQLEAFLANLPSRLAYNVGEIRIGGMSKGAHGMFVTLGGPPGVGRVLGNVLRHAPGSE